AVLGLRTPWRDCVAPDDHGYRGLRFRSGAPHPGPEHPGRLSRLPPDGPPPGEVHLCESAVRHRVGRAPALFWSSPMRHPAALAAGSCTPTMNTLSATAIPSAWNG